MFHLANRGDCGTFAYELDLGLPVFDTAQGLPNTGVCFDDVTLHVSLIRPLHDSLLLLRRLD